MKSNVIKRFRDKYTKKIHNVGSVYESTDERVRELQGLGYLEKEDNKEPSLLHGNVGEVTAAITAELGKEKLEVLLQEEKEGKNRKGVAEHIEALLAE